MRYLVVNVSTLLVLIHTCDEAVDTCPAGETGEIERVPGVRWSIWDQIIIVRDGDVILQLYGHLV